MLKQGYSYIIAIALLFIFSNCQPQNPIAKKINEAEMEELMKNPELQIIDVRTPQETQQGVINGALEINFHDKSFKEQISKLDKSKPTVVYCASGGRSASAMDIFVSEGFTEVYDLTGGYRKWSKTH